MTEAEQNLRAIYHKMGGLDADIDWVDNCIREVALATLKDARAYLVAAHEEAQPVLDEHDSDTVDDTERLIEQIDLLIAVSEE